MPVALRACPALGEEPLIAGLFSTESPQFLRVEDMEVGFYLEPGYPLLLRAVAQAVQKGDPGLATAGNLANVV
jgi:hypothetical protein